MWCYLKNYNDGAVMASKHDIKTISSLYPGVGIAYDNATNSIIVSDVAQYGTFTGV